MIQQATERLSPVEEAMIRSVLAGGGAEADFFVRAGQPLRVDQSIQLGDLGGLEDVVKHQIAVKIEEILLQLGHRVFHPHQSHTACPITSGLSRSGSQDSSSVNIVTHCRQEHFILLMSVPQNMQDEMLL